MIIVVISHLRVRNAVTRLATPLVLGALTAVMVFLHVETA
jgi:hypothetical protein